MNADGEIGSAQNMELDTDGDLDRTGRSSVMHSNNEEVSPTDEPFAQPAGIRMQPAR